MISQTENMLFRLSNLDTQQKKLSYQMSTGEELQRGSENSSLYARQLYINDKVRTYTGLQNQLDKITSQNSVADSTVSSIKTALEYINSELIKANTSTTTGDALKTISVGIQGVKESLLSFVNDEVEGEYLFAGSDSSIKPFSVDENGKVSYVGDNGLRKIAVEDGRYRERGINGFDVMYYASSTAYKGEDLTFTADSKIFDQSGLEWKLNETNDTLVQYDKSGVETGESITGITNDGATPPTYSATMPNTDGLKFEAKESIFDKLDSVINTLKGFDELDNPISVEDARAKLGPLMDDLSSAYDSVNAAHADLGGKNKVFELASENISSKLNQFNMLYTDIASANLSEVAVQTKALELTYTALYSTISKTNQLSLVNFI